MLLTLKRDVQPPKQGVEAENRVRISLEREITNLNLQFGSSHS